MTDIERKKLEYLKWIHKDLDRIARALESIQCVTGTMELTSEEKEDGGKE